MNGLEVSQYIGEHQSQAFYGSVGIRLGDGSVRQCRLGAPTPIDLSAVGDDTTGCTQPPPPCLCIPIHIFRRLVAASGSIASRLADERAAKEDATAAEPQATKKSLLVTIQTYFPVRCMGSANESKITPDLKKRIHIPPHDDEFVQYPSMLTLSAREFGQRVLRGVARARQLRCYSKAMPEMFVPGVKNLHEHEEAETNYLILPESLYNRIASAEKMFQEGRFAPKRPRIGWNAVLPSAVIQELVETEEDSPDWYKWAGLCTAKVRYPSDDSQNDDSSNKCDNNNEQQQQQQQQQVVIKKEPAADLTVVKFDLGEDCPMEEQQQKAPLANNNNNSSSLVPRLHRFKITMSAMDMNTRKNHEFFLSSKFNHVHRSVACCWPFRPQHNIRLVFVRRQSNDCGALLAQNFKVQKFTPARIRRTRVRGTDQLAIRLKRPLFSLDSNGSVVAADENSLHSLACLDAIASLEENATLEANTYEVQLESFLEHVDTSWQSLVQTNSQSNSPALRPRRNILDLHVSASDSSLLQNYDFDRGKRQLRVHHAAKQRLDQFDSDLELALQRSLEDSQNKDEEESSATRSTAIMAMMRNRIISNNARESSTTPPPQNGRRGTRAGKTPAGGLLRRPSSRRIVASNNNSSNNNVVMNHQRKRTSRKPFDVMENAATSAGGAPVKRTYKKRKTMNGKNGKKDSTDEVEESQEAPPPPKSRGRPRLKKESPINNSRTDNSNNKALPSPQSNTPPASEKAEEDEDEDEDEDEEEVEEDEEEEEEGDTTQEANISSGLFDYSTYSPNKTPAHSNRETSPKLRSFQADHAKTKLPEVTHDLLHPHPSTMWSQRAQMLTCPPKVRSQEKSAPTNLPPGQFKPLVTPPPQFFGNNVGPGLVPLEMTTVNKPFTAGPTTQLLLPPVTTTATTTTLVNPFLPTANFLPAMSQPQPVPQFLLTPDTFNFLQALQNNSASAAAAQVTNSRPQQHQFQQNVMAANFLAAATSLPQHHHPQQMNLPFGLPTASIHNFSGMPCVQAHHHQPSTSATIFPLQYNPLL